jgi:hypothetical protein
MSCFIKRCTPFARERAGLTHVQLAKLLRKPQSFVSNHERGQRRIDVLELLRIVEVLKGNPRRLFADIINGAPNDFSSCPTCGSRDVVSLFSLPSERQSASARKR